MDYHYNKPELTNTLVIDKQSVIVSLTDGSTHFDVCFCVLDRINVDFALYQRGVATQAKPVLIGINGANCFVFNVDKWDIEESVNYIQEKLKFTNHEIAKQISEIANLIGCVKPEDVPNV